MNRKQRRQAGRNGGIVPPHLQTAIRNGATAGGASAGKDNSATKPDGAPRKSLTVGMGGFDGLIHQLSGVPLLVNRALPLLERGDVAKASGQLTDALIKVELGKAAILGNLALAAMKAGDIGAAVGYVDIALESLNELGLEETEIYKMLALVHANLPGEATDNAATAGGVVSAAGVEMPASETPDATQAEPVVNTGKNGAESE